MHDSPQASGGSGGWRCLARAGWTRMTKQSGCQLCSDLADWLACRKHAGLKATFSPLESCSRRNVFRILHGKVLFGKVSLRQGLAEEFREGAASFTGSRRISRGLGGAGKGGARLELLFAACFRSFL